MPMSHSLTQHRRLWYLVALISACYLVSTGCGGSKRVQRSSTLLEEPIDSLPDIEKYPVMIKEGRPKYPKKAKEAGWEGIVWVSVLIDKRKSQKCQNCEVIRIQRTR